MPSAKFALVLARRALACACNACNSRFLAFNSPDLFVVSSGSLFDVRLRLLTFASVSPGCGPWARDCMSARVDRSCSPVGLRSLRLQSMIRIRCPHSYLTLKSTVLHQMSIRFQVARVGILIAGCRLMCCGHGEAGTLAGAFCLVH